MYKFTSTSHIESTEAALGQCLKDKIDRLARKIIL
jgi:hypothetical protein